MEDNREALKKAVDMIKRRGVRKEVDITEEEMAGKLGISGKQFYSYLNGEDEAPDGLASKLQSAYGIKTFSVRSTQRVTVRTLPNEVDKAERNRNSLKAVISLIKKSGEAKGVTITEEEMAGKTEISLKQLNAYLNGEGTIPRSLLPTLRSAYENHFNAFQMESNRKFLKHTIVIIRNRGLVKAMNITVEEMAGKIDISMEQLYAYLSGEYDTMDDWSSKLYNFYKDLLTYDEVEIIEDVYLDKKARKVKLL